MGLKGFVMGGIAGAAIAYLFDPQQGKGRRARAADMAAARARRLRREAERKARYVQGRVQGVVRVPDLDHEPTDDRTLVDRIKSEVSAIRDAPHPILVEALEGVVTLRGQVDGPAHAEVIEGTVRAVPGVMAVRNLMHTPEEPARNKRGSTGS